MPLAYANIGEKQVIRKICGSACMKRRLEDIGFYVGGHVTVLMIVTGNLIVKICESRIAICQEMATKIMV